VFLPRRSSLKFSTMSALSPDIDPIPAATSVGSDVRTLEINFHEGLNES
jgi:hypothetical protein